MYFIIRIGEYKDPNPLFDAEHHEKQEAKEAIEARFGGESAPSEGGHVKALWSRISVDLIPWVGVQYLEGGSHCRVRL